MKKSKIFLLIFIITLFFPSIAIAKAPLKGKSSVEWINSRISTFDKVISSFKAAGIDTKNLEKIAVKTKYLQENHTNSREIVKLSRDFTKELMKIQEEQDKKDVERALFPLKEAVNNADADLNKLRAKGEDIRQLKTRLTNIKRTIHRAEKYYNSKNYELAEKETAIAFEEFSAFYSEIKPILEKHMGE